MSIEEKVSGLGKELEKLVSEGKADDKEAMDCLTQLQNSPITLDVLQKTRIGMSVNVVRKASSKEDVQGMAKMLIKSWKKLLDSQDKNKAKVGNQTAGKSNDIRNSQDSNSSNGSVQSNGDSRSSQEKPTKTATKSNPGANITIKHSYPVFKGDGDVRNKCREMLFNSLKCDDHPDIDLEALADHIEEAVFNEFKDTGPKYKNRIKSRVMNLRDKKNPTLKLCVIDGSITPFRFATMKPEEMASEDMKKIRQEFTQQAIKDHQLSVTGGTGTDQFKCGRCGKRNTTYNQVQTRSADEPMTTFVLCNECGKRWKFC